ncbi:MAG TPA: rRNA maturation RNase YbeY [Bryobacteraceae bacterium]|nr:rRNA maturation RNase YbeY [Bryobacteraceae bacterium]
MSSEPNSGPCTLLFEVPARGVSRRALRDFARRLQQEVAGGREFCCLISNDDHLRELNRQFRRKDYATDVLSFPPGELAISWDRAATQALEYGHSPAEELSILMLHGVLHLIGMDHESDAGEMARAERRWRKRLNLPVGVIERVSA